MPRCTQDTHNQTCTQTLGHTFIPKRQGAQRDRDTSRKQPKTEAQPDRQKVPQINQEIHPQDYTQRHKSKNSDMPRETYLCQVTDTEMCVQTHPAGLGPLSPTLGAPYLAYITPHVASAGAPMLAGLGEAGVHLLLTVAARVAFRAHAVVGIILVHTLPTCLTQLFQPYPCTEESGVRHASAPPCLHRSQHHRTSLLASVTRVSRTLHRVVTQPPQLARCQSLTH